MTQKGKAGTKPGNDSLCLARGRRAKGAPANAQMRRPGRRLWTEPRKQEFIEALGATCNVREACRVVGMGDRGVYLLRDRDPAFAAAWKKAVEQGYSELEMLLLRQSLHGTETTEIIDDGNPDGRKRVKTVHSYPHGTALRLLLSHKSAVDAYRAEQGVERPGSAEMRAEILVKIAAMRARADDYDDGDENA